MSENSDVISNFYGAIFVDLSKRNAINKIAVDSSTKCKSVEEKFCSLNNPNQHQYQPVVIISSPVIKGYWNELDSFVQRNVIRSLR